MVGFLVTTLFLVSLYPDMVERDGGKRESEGMGGRERGRK